MSLAAIAVTGGGDWFAWVLSGALGGLLTLLLAIAVGKAYRRRDRALPTGVLPHRAIATAIAGQAARAPAPSSSDRRSSSRLPTGSAVIGYLTVAATSGATEDSNSLTAIEATCEGCGWKLLETVRDREEGPTLDRPGLGYALERIADGQAQGLVVSDLERLSRSIVDLGVLMAWFRDAHATLIALDLDIDTSTPEGQHVATTLITLSAREHERIARGTRRGLAEGRESGRSTGRPAVSQRPELVERITAMRAANMSLRAIADQLNAEGIPTLRGGKKWRPSSIQAAVGYRRPSARDHLPPPHP